MQPISRQDSLFALSQLFLAVNTFYRPAANCSVLSSGSLLQKHLSELVVPGNFNHCVMASLVFQCKYWGVLRVRFSSSTAYFYLLSVTGLSFCIVWEMYCSESY